MRLPTARGSLSIQMVGHLLSSTAAAAVAAYASALAAHAAAEAAITTITATASGAAVVGGSGPTAPSTQATAARRSGGMNILNFLHEKQATTGETPSVVEAVPEPPQTPSVAYQIAAPGGQGGGETADGLNYQNAAAPKPNPNAGKRKCQSIWDGDCDRSELGDADWHGQGRKRPCQSAWDGDCDRAALRELQLPSQGPTREEWANREKVALVNAAAATQEHVQRQVVQDRVQLLESSGLDELEPVAVPG